MARATDPRFDSSDILEERRAVRERVVWLCTRLGETGSVTSDDTVPCSLPVATEPASVYREYTPPPALKEFLICTWTLETLARSQPHQQRVLPDGCSDIVWFGQAQPVVVAADEPDRFSPRRTPAQSWSACDSDLKSHRECWVSPRTS